MTIEFTEIGPTWPHSGDLFTMGRANQEARVYVDSLGETWVDIRRIPEGGYFFTERVEAFRAVGGSVEAQETLREKGFAFKRSARYAHRVIERDI